MKLFISLLAGLLFGLGLAICDSIIKYHNGLITVESLVGVGTTFMVYLPAYDAPAVHYRTLLLRDRWAKRFIDQHRFSADGQGQGHRLALG